ncbi:MAG: hypothetical protein Q4D65_04505 [Peptostreptococcaceae bacterium]|nr:hypothetical protein [Peptostreptococcaceae bacterium]
MEKLHHIFESKGFVNSMGFYDYLSSIYKRYQIALEHFITRIVRLYQKMLHECQDQERFDENCDEPR